MDNTYIGFFREVWKSPPAKQVIAILLAIPVFLVIFYNVHNKELRVDNKELKSEVKNLNLLVIKTLEKCNKENHLIDSIHTARFNSYRDNSDKDSRETIRELRADIKEAHKSLEEAKKANNQIQEIVNTKK